MDNKKIVTGGAAFPRVPTQWGNGDTVWGTPGMTLRDYFAAKAMGGLLSRTHGYSSPGLAGLAYTYADAMLQERRESE